MAAFDTHVYSHIAEFLGADDLGALAQTSRAARAAAEYEMCERAGGGAAAARGDLLGACLTGFLPLVLAAARAPRVAGPADPDSATWEKVFSKVCGMGALGVARWMADRGVQPRDGAALALCAACQYGHIGVARWYVRAFAPRNLRGALNFASTGGQLGVVQWLVTDHFSPAAPGSKARSAITGLCGALWHACAHGWLEVAQWLVGHCGATADEVRLNNNSMLRAASAGGHLATVQYIVKEFGLGAGAAQARDVLQAACAVGRAEVAQWIASALFPAAPAPLTSREANILMRDACDRGTASFVYWLVRDAPFAPEDGWAACSDAGLLRACWGGRLAVAHCLVELFDVTRARVLAPAGPLAEAADMRRTEIVQWLIERFALTADDVRGVADVLDDAGTSIDHDGRTSGQWLADFAA